MGEHRRPKLCAIEDWLNEKHGESESTDLNFIYSKERLTLKPKPRALKADYVKMIDGNRIYADVFGPGDDWRQVLGKILCYAANGEREARDGYQVWLVTDFDDDSRTEKAEKHDAAVEGWLMWFRTMMEIARQVLRPEIAGRIKFKHAKVVGGKITELLEMT